MPPFTPAMAKKHKKGLSAKQARQWSHVATAAYAKCIKAGSSAAHCESSAIRQASGAVGAPELSTNQRRFAVNAALTAPPKHISDDDHEYLVAPAVLIVEGVLNAAYITAEAFIPSAWDGIPVLLNHPQTSEGLAMSANTVAVLADHCLGWLENPRLGQGLRHGQAVPSLQADIWLDIAECVMRGGEALQVLQMLEKGDPLEGSTGFFATGALQRGSFLGTPYNEIHTAIIPDHFALLPNGIGACSWSDGCGAGRLNEATCSCPDPTLCTCYPEELPMEEVLPVPRLQRLWHLVRDFVRHEDIAEEAQHDASKDDPQPVVVIQASELEVNQTDKDLRDALMGCLYREADGEVMPMWVESVDAVNQYFIYHCGPQLCRRYWQLVDDVVTLLPGIEDVQQQTDYVVVPGSGRDAAAAMEDEATMAMQAPSVTIKMRVNRLITNGAQTGWMEEDRHFLEGQDEAFLVRLEHQPRHIPQVAPQEPTTLEEALAYVPLQFRETLSNATRAYEQRKTQLIDILMANKQNPFAQEELSAMAADRLEKMVMMAGEDLPEQTPRANQTAQYNGRRLPQLRIVNEEEDAVPEMPKTLAGVVALQRANGMRI
jgi:hypothetical protein